MCCEVCEMFKTVGFLLSPNEICEGKNTRTMINTGLRWELFYSENIKN